MMYKTDFLKNPTVQTTFSFFQLLLNRQQRFNPETRAFLRLLAITFCLFHTSYIGLIRVQLSQNVNSLNNCLGVGGGGGGCV